MVNKYRHCFTGLSKELFEDTRSPRLKRLHLLRDVAILLYATLYLGTVWYAWKFTNFNLPFYDIRLVDAFADYFARHQAEYDPFLILVFLLFALFDFACQVAFYRLPTQATTWRWWHQMTVVNQEAYYAARVEDPQDLEKTYQAAEREMRLYLEESVWGKVLNLVPEIVEKKCVQSLARLSVWLRLGHINRRAFFGRRLQVIPGLSNRVRRRILFFTLAYDAGFYLLQLGYVFLYALIMVINFILEGALDLSRHPWYTLPLGVAWFTLIYLVLLRLIRSAIFFIGCTLLGTIVYTGHVREMDATVEKALSGLKGRRACLHPSNHPVLYRHLHEHNLVCYLVLRGCQTLFGSVLFTFLLLHLPINVYLIGRNVFTNPPPLVRLILWLIAGFQVSSAAVVFLPLAWCCGVYHHPKAFIPKLQAAMVGRRWLVYKLKYDDLYNRLLQGPKMAVFIGNMSKPITFSSALEFLFLYIGYLLMSFSQIIDANLQKDTQT